MSNQLSPQEAQTILDVISRAPMQNIAEADRVKTTAMKFMNWINELEEIKRSAANPPPAAP